MNTHLLLTLASRNPLADWTPLWVLLGAFAAVVVALTVLGRRDASTFFARVPNGLQRVTGIPGWAAAMVGTALFGLLVAGVGFYNDVAWHVALGRDKALFTAPHTMIVVGLAFIAFAAVLGVFFATITDAEVGVKVGPLRVPWSAIPLGVLGFTALGGFPLDDLWHAHYGVDVTMWSPTHLLMILGASLSPIAAWLALGEAGVKPTDGVWARVAHTVTAMLVLAGLTSVLGEFEFGVPQFQQLYHPLLICLAAGIALVSARLILGPGNAVLVGGLAALSRVLNTPSHVVQTRAAALFLAPAVAVELAALFLGTTRRIRFAIASGVGIATIGLAGEYAWNRHAHQPWTTNLFPSAVLLGGLIAIGAALLAVALAGGVRREGPGIPRWAVALGALAVLVGLALPLPRHAGSVQAAIQLAHQGDSAVVHVTLSPPDAADHARWFQTTAWQGGGMVVSNMHREGPGRYVSDRAVPVTGHWKTLLRLHRGDQLMAAPVWMPADAEIGKPQIPAVDRTIAFAHEQKYLLREAHSGPATFAVIAYVLLTGVVLAWGTAFVLAAKRHRTRRADAARPTRAEPVAA
jgi:hypothetical protein